MINRIQVLVIGRQEEIMQTVLQLINNTPDWEAFEIEEEKKNKLLNLQQG